MSDLLINNKLKLTDVEAVIFDKDGTLIDVHHYWASMLKIRAKLIVNKYKLDGNVKNELMNVMGIDTETSKIKPDGPVGIKPRSFIVSVATEVLNYYNVNAAHNDVEDMFLEADKKTSKNMLPLLKLLPGVNSLLSSLKKNNVKMFIASTDLSSRSRGAMEALNIDGYFSDIIGGDSVKNTKPSPDLALKIINRFNFDSNKVVVIGDHPVDILMGNTASVGLSVGVLTGLSEEATFKGLDCHLASNLTDIKIIK